LPARRRGRRAWPHRRTGCGRRLTPSEGLQSQTPKPHRNRLHLDLYADDQAAEVARLEALGARQPESWPYPPDADFVVLLDPDDNEFCVIDCAPGSAEAATLG
jgi:hypothetical protein